MSAGTHSEGSGNEAVAAVRRLADSLWPHAVRAVATLGLADLIAAGERRPAELAAAAGTDADATARLLAYLAGRGVVRPDGDGGYALTPAGELLRDGHPEQLRTRLDQRGLAGRLDQTAASLLETLQTGKPVYPSLFGRSYYADLAVHPHLFAEFDAFAKHYLAPAIGTVLGRGWADVDVVVDVGGGTGTLLTRLLGAEPHLRGILVDLPDTVAQARATLAAAGLADRVEVVPGSFFDLLPTGGDVYLLSGVLIDWPDGDATEILRRCGEAAGPRGRVLIAEQRAVDEAAATDEDLRILLLVGGRARTVEQFGAIAGDAGLRVASAHRNADGVCLVECVPAS
ncbi:methyltransferase [Actinomadura parmotrematis]|uniref:Methyltransferase n=1 Tax=Actinomadura parmotrematis TaxID=2864039 RepID=A0ABS7G1R2_9ACTN|nr:methyltransferase [Actinomadura parmotrematis]MBW8486446.1 methyltransferase [Actinomadura parmotrematis]